MLTLSLIVAAAENGTIGRDNALPWRLPEDMKYFRSVTMGKPVIMGRRTYESIGKPLSGRANIVITRQADYVRAGVQVVHSLGEALRLAQEIARVDDVDEAVVIGGADIYAEALPQTSRLYLTRVHAEVAGDVVFPAVDWAQWREVSREDHVAEAANPFDYSFVVYERIEH